MRKPSLLAAALLFSFLFAPPPAAQPAWGRRAVYISFADAEQAVAALGEILPPELKGKGRDEIAAAWPSWVVRYDAAIRARLARGDEDSLVNFLLFGTSFTRQPRVTAAHIAQLGQAVAARPDGEQGQGAPLIQSRVGDLVRAAAAPGSNERLLFARRVLEVQKGFRLGTAAGRARAEEYLLSSVARVLGENTGYARAIEAARLQGNPSEEFAERSRLYRTRGLSSDTSLLPNLAVEEALAAIKSRGLIAAGGVVRVAIIGPGLDFTDKQEGYDFYPQQTVQPFAVMDTLLRLGLSRPGALRVTTLDLSPRVNDHLARAAGLARRGQPYVIQLPRDPRAGWKAEAVSYWERFGDQIGAPATPIRVPAGAGELKLRAVRVRPEIASRVVPVDANIVLQRLDLPAAEKFDLIVATNIFVYYDTFDQSLAVLNVERMLRPGGLLLSNNALLELPFFRVRSVGYSTTVYSDRDADGDHIVWYRRLPD